MQVDDETGVAILSLVRATNAPSFMICSSLRSATCEAGMLAYSCSRHSPQGMQL